MMEKRTASVQNILNYLSQHRTDPFMNSVANDLMQIGETVNEYIANGNPASLNSLTLAIESYATDIKNERVFGKLLKQYMDHIYSGSTRRSFYD